MNRLAIKRLCILALFTAMALTIFVIEAQIPLPVPIPGVKLGLANVITLIILAEYRARDALIVLVLRILLGAIFSGQIMTLAYSLCGGLLCFCGCALLCKLLRQRYLWFISVIGAVLHNVGQILAAVVIMQTTKVFVYLPFLLITGCITGVFTGLVATAVVRHYPNVAKLPSSSKEKSSIKIEQTVEDTSSIEENSEDKT